MRHGTRTNPDIPDVRKIFLYSNTAIFLLELPFIYPLWHIIKFNKLLTVFYFFSRKQFGILAWIFSHPHNSTSRSYYCFVLWRSQPRIDFGQCCMHWLELNFGQKYAVICVHRVLKLFCTEYPRLLESQDEPFFLDMFDCYGYYSRDFTSCSIFCCLLLLAPTPHLPGAYRPLQSKSPAKAKEQKSFLLVNSPFFWILGETNFAVSRQNRLYKVLNNDSDIWFTLEGETQQSSKTRSDQNTWKRWKGYWELILQGWSAASATCSSKCINLTEELFQGIWLVCAEM